MALVFLSIQTLADDDMDLVPGLTTTAAILEASRVLEGFIVKFDVLGVYCMGRSQRLDSDMVLSISLLKILRRRYSSGRLSSPFGSTEISY